MQSILDECQSVFGTLSADCRKRLREVLLHPTPETWDEAFSVIIGGRGFTTLWQAVIAVDDRMPRRAADDEDTAKRWPYVPDAVTIARAIRFATG